MFIINQGHLFGVNIFYVQMEVEIQGPQYYP